MARTIVTIRLQKSAKTDFAIQFYDDSGLAMLPDFIGIGSSNSKALHFLKKKFDNKDEGMQAAEIVKFIISRKEIFYDLIDKDLNWEETKLSIEVKQIHAGKGRTDFKVTDKVIFKISFIKANEVSIEVSNQNTKLVISKLSEQALIIEQLKAFSVLDEELAEILSEYILFYSFDTKPTFLLFTKLVKLKNKKLTINLFGKKGAKDYVSGYFIPYVLQKAHQFATEDKPYRSMNWNTGLYVVDIDVNTPDPVFYVDLENYLSRISFIPLLYAKSHGGGAHIYVEQYNQALILKAYLESTTLSFKQIDINKNARFTHLTDDTKEEPRPPRNTLAELNFTIQQIDSFWLKYPTVVAFNTAEENSEILEQFSLKEGDRLPHSACPIKESASNSQDCVLVGHTVITCFACNQKFPIAYLNADIDFQHYSDLYVAIKNRRTFFEALATICNRFDSVSTWSQKDQRRLYYGLINLLCPDFETECKNAMSMAEFPLLMTFGNRYLDMNNGQYQTSREGPIDVDYLKHLPAIVYEKDPFKQLETLRRLKRAQPDEAIGIYETFTTSGYTLRESIKQRVFSTRTRDRWYPKYLPEEKRMSKDEIREILYLNNMPKVEALAEYFIISKLFADYFQKILPIVYVTGPSGSGKTLAADFAAAILRNTLNKADIKDKVIGNDPLAQIAKTPAGQFLVFDEAVQASERVYGTPDAIPYAILDYALYQNIRILYQETKITGPHVIVMTSLKLPFAFNVDFQLQRRFLIFEMSSVITDIPHQFCTDIRPLHPHFCTEDHKRTIKAADSWLSNIEDEHFSDINDVKSTKDWLINKAKLFGLTIPGIPDEAKEAIKLLVDSALANAGKLVITSNGNIQHSNDVLSRKLTDAWQLINCTEKRMSKDRPGVTVGTEEQQSEYLTPEILRQIYKKEFKISSVLNISSHKFDKPHLNIIIREKTAPVLLSEHAAEMEKLGKSVNARKLEDL